MPAALAGHELCHVDRFLNVAACFLEHLAHLARHIACEVFLAVPTISRAARSSLGATRSGHQPPRLERPRGRIYGRVNVSGSRVLE